MAGSRGEEVVRKIFDIAVEFIKAWKQVKKNRDLVVCGSDS